MPVNAIKASLAFAAVASLAISPVAWGDELRRNSAEASGHTVAREKRLASLVYDTTQCSNWVQIKAGTWGSVCVGVSNYRTNAWATIINNSGAPVTAAMYVYVKNELVPHAVFRTDYGTTIPNGGRGDCNTGAWKWVASPRWARAWFWIDGVSLWITSPSLP